MEQIDHVKINKTTGIVTVGGGTVYEQLINATYAAGREMSPSHPPSPLFSSTNS